jgi:hypothetical protein
MILVNRWKKCDPVKVRKSKKTQLKNETSIKKGAKRTVPINEAKSKNLIKGISFERRGSAQSATTRTIFRDSNR